MLKRFLSIVFAIPVGILMVALAIANRHQVPFVLDPFRPEQPMLSIELPFFAYLLIALVAGVILGGVAAWMSQSRWRQTARKETKEAARWRLEADRLTRERDDKVESRSNLMLSAGE